MKSFVMYCHRLLAKLALCAALVVAPSALADPPRLHGIGDAMQKLVTKNEIAGAVTVVATRNHILHFEATGFADVAAKRAMSPETLFWLCQILG